MREGKHRESLGPQGWGTSMGPDGWGPGFHKMAPAKPRERMNIEKERNFGRSGGGGPAERRRKKKKGPSAPPRQLKKKK